MLSAILFTIYSAVFPSFLPERADLKPEPAPHAITWRRRDRLHVFCMKHRALGRVVGHIQMNYYMPIFHPLLWWRHMRAVNELLDSVGWINLDG
jgi:hypothetical protein